MTTVVSIAATIATTLPDRPLLAALAALTAPLLVLATRWGRKDTR